MKILAAITDVAILRFFKNSLRLPIEERRVKKRTNKRWLVYDPSSVTGWDIEKKLEE